VSLQRSPRSTLSRLDDLLLIGVAAVAAIAVFWMIGWVVSAVLFLVKIAVAAVVFGLIVRAVINRR
jgi:hypothetical protein